jgi:hypothetical protein
MSALILYTAEDGRNQIKPRANNQTVWLTQREMAELFAVSVDNIGPHLKNLYEDGEPLREATTEGGRASGISGLPKNASTKKCATSLP